MSIIQMHGFKLFKLTNPDLIKAKFILVDGGYQGIKRIHTHSQLPKKKTKLRSLTKADKKQTASYHLSKQPMSMSLENASVLKSYRVATAIAEKKFGSRVNLISVIDNFGLGRLGERSINTEKI